MKRILVYRFSAMGDVVMLLPVLKGLLDANHELEIYLLTRPFLFPVFKGIERLHLIPADLNGVHKGAKGLHRLYKQIKNDVQPDAVFDQHQVLRTYFLNLYFRLGGCKVFRLKKGHFAKRLAVLTKSHKTLPGTIDRYAATFKKAGLQINFPQPPLFAKTSKAEVLKKLRLEPEENVRLVGIAPFAKHAQKVWGVEKVEQLIQELDTEPNIRFILFGGGEKEISQLDELALKSSNAIVAAHFLKLADELKMLSVLDVMISMDSANMHLASMAGVPVLSIWGATHPSLGFAPYRQPEAHQIQYNGPELKCRPCSVFGNKKCKYGDVRCMQNIPVKLVAEKSKAILDTLP